MHYGWVCLEKNCFSGLFHSSQCDNNSATGRGFRISNLLNLSVNVSHQKTDADRNSYIYVHCSRELTCLSDDYRNLQNEILAIQNLFGSQLIDLDVF